MPVNKASESIHLAEEDAKTHSVQFAVYTRLATSDVSKLHDHLAEHLAFQKRLYADGVLGVSGPFYTEDGKNSGNGLYVLRVDNIDQAKQLAAEDPFHKMGIRIGTVEPWLEVVH